MRVTNGYQSRWIRPPLWGQSLTLYGEKNHNKVFILFFSWEKNAQLTQKCFSFSIVDTVVISTSKSMHSAKRVFPYCLFACLFFVLWGLYFTIWSSLRWLLLQICVKQIQLNWLVCHFCGFLATKQFGSFKIFIYFVMTNSIILNYLVLSDIQWPLSTICSQSELPWPVCCVYCMWHVGSLELAGMGGEDARTEQHWIHPQVSIVLLQKKVKASEKIMLCHESIFF